MLDSDTIARSRPIKRRLRSTGQLFGRRYSNVSGPIRQIWTAPLPKATRNESPSSSRHRSMLASPRCCCPRTRAKGQVQYHGLQAVDTRHKLDWSTALFTSCARETSSRLGVCHGASWYQTSKPTASTDKNKLTPTRHRGRSNGFVAEPAPLVANRKFSTVRIDLPGRHRVGGPRL